MSKNIRKRRTKLWNEKNGLCYWCGVKTVLPPRGSNRHLPTNDLATLDHLRTRLDDLRQVPNTTNEERTVLSCWRCNGIRGALLQKPYQTISIKVKKKHIVYKSE